MKDAKGHGSEKRGGGSGPDTSGAQRFAGMFNKGDASEFAKRIGTGELHTQDIAAQHGIPTSIWSRPAGSSMNMVSNAARDRTAALNKTYNRNENNNFHSENIALLAKNFGTPGEHAQAKEIIAARNKEGGLPSSTQNVLNVRDWQYGIHQKYIGKLTGR
jgi:hypothetical protein